MFVRKDKIMITGGTGFLGKALVEELLKHGYFYLTPLSSQDGNLTQRYVVDGLIELYKPDIIVHLAAHVGGIGANMRKPAEFFFDNISMGVNLIDSAARHGVKKFVQVGTVCSYPSDCPVPFQESNLWNGYPEPTNAPYGIAKKSLLVMLDAYRKQYNFNSVYLLPVNLYGPGDNFDVEDGHVIPCLITKIANAKKCGDKYIDVWGTGKASREFLYVEDCVKAICLAIEKVNIDFPINIGSGKEITIERLVNLLSEFMEFKGEVRWDTSKPDGQLRRCLDTSLAKQHLGFESTTNIVAGLRNTINWFYKEIYNANAS
jgi:GDP-L-fucose synthase